MHKKSTTSGPLLIRNIAAFYWAKRLPVLITDEPHWVKRVKHSIQALNPSEGADDLLTDSTSRRQ